jgi:flagellar biosynthesis/type III secretory pathway protein FliH
MANTELQTVEKFYKNAKAFLLDFEDALKSIPNLQDTIKEAQRERDEALNALKQAQKSFENGYRSGYFDGYNRGKHDGSHPSSSEDTYDVEGDLTKVKL